MPKQFLVIGKRAGLQPEVVSNLRAQKRPVQPKTKGIHVQRMAEVDVFGISPKELTSLIRSRTVVDLSFIRSPSRPIRAARGAFFGMTFHLKRRGSNAPQKSFGETHHRSRLI